MKSPYILIATILVVGCGRSSDDVPQINTGTKVLPTYASINEAIFQKSCIKCHDEHHGHGGYAGISFNSYENAIKAITKGYPEQSRLYVALKSGKMPLSGTKPSDDQIQAVYDWILSGASK